MSWAVISLRVNVPVLSEQITVTAPRISTAGRRRIRSDCRRARQLRHDALMRLSGVTASGHLERLGHLHLASGVLDPFKLQGAALAGCHLEFQVGVCGQRAEKTRLEHHPVIQ